VVALRPSPRGPVATQGIPTVGTPVRRAPSPLSSAWRSPRVGTPRRRLSRKPAGRRRNAPAAIACGPIGGHDDRRG
jgi:hypothetical protein